MQINKAQQYQRKAAIVEQYIIFGMVALSLNTIHMINSFWSGISGYSRMFNLNWDFSDL